MLFSSPRERERDLTTRRVFLRLAVLPLAFGPSFPGARAGSPLSRIATSPLQHASRHPFAIPVFQQAAFPRGRALTDVRESLGPRARFRALCLTPRFFGPRCRQTNSAISLLDARARSSNGCPRPHRLVSIRFSPTSVTRRDCCEPRNSSWGCTPTLARRSPSSRGHTREGMAMNSRGPGDPSEGPTEVGSPPQAPPERPGRRLDLRLGMEPQPRAPGQPKILF